MERDLKSLGVHLFLLLALVIGLTACSENREEKLPEAEAERVFSLAEIRGTVAKVTLGQDASKELSSLGFGSASAMVRYPVVQVSGAGRLAPLFENLVLPGAPGEVITVKFDVDEYSVFAYRVLPKTASSAFTRNIIDPAARGADADQAEKQIVLFSVKVLRVGVLTPRKNSLDEDSHIQRLQDTAWDSATHVYFSPANSGRTIIGLDARDESKTFHQSQVEDKIFNRQEFLDQFQVPLSEDVPGEVFVTKVNGDKLLVYRVVSKADFDSEELRLLMHAEGAAYAFCSEQAQAKGESIDIRSEDCALKLHQEVRIRHVAFDRAPVNNDPRYRSAKLIAVNVDADRANGFFQIGSPVAEDVDLGKVCQVDPAKTLKVRELEKQEFLFRRTLQDSPNRFPLAFTGVGAKLEIVRFVFDQDRVYVRRARALSPNPNTTDVDYENLISLSAKYKRAVHRDRSGQKLSSPKCVDAKPNEPGAFAVVDWTRNEFPVVASPLSYYWIGQCFARQGPQEVRDVDSRLSDDAGVLNFTLESNYSLSPWIRCTNQWLTSGFAEYWYPTQTNFTFRERVSFKRHDQKSDHLVLSDVPYYAQKQLNYGVFTFSRREPNEFGNVGLDGTVKNLPMLHDFQTKKKLTYVLKGIPSSGTLRDKLIEATEEVVADWNKTLRRAFKHTPMETEADIIELLVEGRDDGATGELGDLDKNFIYYEAKNLGNWILGMAGPSPNPRSGVIESSNVLIYGGNMLSYLEYAIKMAKARRDYAENMKPVKADRVEPFSMGGRAGVNGSGASPGETGEGSGDREEYRPGLWSDLALTGSTAIDADGFSEALEGASFDEANLAADLFDDFGSNFLDEGTQDRSLSASNGSETRDVLSNLLSSTTASLKALSDSQNHPELKYLEEIFNRGAAEGVLTDAERLKPIVDKTMVEHLQNHGGLPELDRQLMIAEASKDAFMQEVIQSINAGPSTLETMTMGHGANLLEDSIEDSLVDSYRKTLAHELGHALGLRHNFFASFDDDNWIHEEEALKKRKIRPLSDRKKFFIRNYSSVMDYMPNSEIKYEGPGPWDTYAIRAAYTGYLEVEKDFGQALSVLNGEEVLDPVLEKPVNVNVLKKSRRDQAAKAKQLGVKLRGQKFVHVKDLMAANGIRSWLDLRTKSLKKIPLLDILYCSDESVFLYPSCNRHDMGTTPAEIVEYMAEEYNAYYSLRNFANDKLRFSWWRIRRYIWRTFYTFARIRHFLDATGFEISKDKEDISKSSERIPIAAQMISEAAVRAGNFFHGVVRTPEASIFLEPEDRFGEAQVRDGRILRYEKKWARDIAVPGARGEISIRGIEIDKAIALMYLTVRRLGIPEYEHAKVRIAFPNLEQAMFPGKKKEDLPTISLLTEIMNNNLKPAFVGPEGELHEITSRNVRTRPTELNRFYAAWGATWALDTYSLEADANFAALFRVGSSVGENSSFDLPVLTQLGESPKSFGSMKYWLFDRAFSAGKIFNSAAATRVALRNTARFVGPFADYFNLRLKRGMTDLVLEERRAAIEAEAMPHGDSMVEASADIADMPIAGDSTFNKELLDQRLELKEAQIEEALAEIPEAMGSKNPDFIVTYMGKQVEIARQLYKQKKALIAQDDPNWDPFVVQLEEARAYNDSIIKDNPLYGFGQQALLTDAIVLPSELKNILKIIINPIGQEIHYGYTFDNLQILNLLFYIRHPEYAR